MAAVFLNTGCTQLLITELEISAPTPPGAQGREQIQLPQKMFLPDSGVRAHKGTVTAAWTLLWHSNADWGVGLGCFLLQLLTSATITDTYGSCTALGTSRVPLELIPVPGGQPGFSGMDSLRKQLEKLKC